MKKIHLCAVLVCGFLLVGCQGGASGGEPPPTTQSSANAILVEDEPADGSSTLVTVTGEMDIRDTAFYINSGWISFTAKLPSSWTAATPEHGRTFYQGDCRIQLDAYLLSDTISLDAYAFVGEENLPPIPIGASRRLLKSHPDFEGANYAFEHEDFLVVLTVTTPIGQEKPHLNDKTDQFAAALADSFSVTQREEPRIKSDLPQLVEIKALALNAVAADVEQKKAAGETYDAGFAGEVGFYPSVEHMYYFRTSRSEDGRLFLVEFHTVAEGLWTGIAVVDGKDMTVIHAATDYFIFSGLSPELSLEGKSRSQTSENNFGLFTVIDNH